MPIETVVDQVNGREITSRTCADISIRIAASRTDREGAFALGYESYRRSGLCDPCSAGVRITPYQLLPTTDIFVAELRGVVISTLSLVRDGQLGLPLESVYPEEVAQRRAAGLRLAECSCLADRRQTMARFFDLFSELARVMVQMAERDGVDQLLIAVHPRHARMYCRAMAFEQIGGHREYPDVNGNPAVALCLDFEAVKRDRPAIWQRFVGEPLPLEVTTPQPLSEVDRWYFEALARRDSNEEFVESGCARVCA